MTITALVGPSSTIADNTNVQIAPAAEYVDSAGKIHLPLPVTYTFHGGTLTVTGMDDTDASGNPVQWVTTMGVMDTFGQFAGTVSTVKTFPAGAAGTPVPYFGTGGMVPVTTLYVSGNAATLAAQAANAVQIAQAAAAQAQAGVVGASAAAVSAAQAATSAAGAAASAASATAAVTTAVNTAVPAAVTAQNIPGQVTTAINTLPNSAFVTTDGGNTYGFPGNASSAGLITQTDVVVAASQAANASLTGVVTTGGNTISVTTTGSPVFKVAADQKSLGISTGCGAMSWLGTSANTVAGKIHSLPTPTTGGLPGSMAAFLRSTLSTTSSLMGFWIGGSGTYQLGFFNGTINDPTAWSSSSSTGAAAGITTVFSAGSITAVVGDVYLLVLDPSTNQLSLKINGTIIKTIQLAALQIGRLGTRQGVWGNAAATQVETFEWVGAVSEATASFPRSNLTVDKFGNLPDGTLAGILAYINGKTLSGPLFDIRKYGAKCDGMLLKDGTMSASSNSLTSATHSFVAADVGKRIGIIGVAPIVANVNGNGVLIASISSVFGGAAILSQNATYAVTTAEVMFGTNDDAAVAATRDAAAVSGGTEVFPAGLHTIVAATYVPTAGVSVAGADRFSSQVWILKNIDATSAPDVIPTGGWMFSWSVSGQNSNAVPFLENVDVHDFTIQCRFWAAATAYSASLKPLNLFKMKNSDIYNMSIYDSPATAIPYDHSVACHIFHNYIVNPGRLCPSGLGPGGSGIGVGTGNSSDGSEWIFGNVIVGTQTATVAGVGQNGIFVESQTNISDLTSPIIEPMNVIGNTVIGMPWGISEAGGSASIIAHNQLIRCGVGIAVRPTNLDTSAPGLDAHIHDNVIRDCGGPNVTWNATGLPPVGAFNGTGILVLTLTGHALSVSAINALIQSNTILRPAKYGFWLHSSTVFINGVRITSDNRVRDAGLSCMRISQDGAGSGFRYLVVKDNDFHGGGLLGVSGENAGILIDSDVQWIGGRLQDNEFYDLKSTQTQTRTYVTNGATMTGVRIAGNTGDP